MNGTPLTNDFIQAINAQYNTKYAIYLSIGEIYRTRIGRFSIRYKMAIVDTVAKTLEVKVNQPKLLSYDPSVKESNLV